VASIVFTKELKGSMKDVIGATTISVPIVNEISNDGIITALQLEEVAFLGMTWGAWFKVGMLVALILLIAERALSIKNKLKE
jgi:hypothetical protein